MLPLVSVIIPVFNAEEFIAEAINSVLAQTYENVECIVVDDGSTDATANIIKGYGIQIKYIYQENAGRSTARNRGVKESSGEYLAFLDADDYYAHEKITNQLSFLESNQNIHIPYSGEIYFQDGKVREYFTLNINKYSGDILSKLIHHNFISICSPIIRRDYFLKAGGFNVSFSYHEDWDLMLRLAVVGYTFGYVNCVYDYCRRHEGNSSRDRLMMYETKLSVIEHFTDVYRDVIVSRTAMTPKQITAMHRAQLGVVLILKGQVLRGQQEISIAVQEQFPHRWKYSVFHGLSKLNIDKILSRIHSMIYKI